MNVSDISGVLESLAPTSRAADWDNVGLLIGDPHRAVKTLMLCIDLTETVLAEAVAAKAQMVMAYHPPIFKPLARLTAASCPVVWAAARANMAVYSMHTALDVARGGTNDVLADILGLTDVNPLEPLTGDGQCKVVVFAPAQDVSAVSAAAFHAGAGRIGDYTECSFGTEGTGTFRGSKATRPAVGKPGQLEQVPELRLEIVCPQPRVAEVVTAIRTAHSYETPAIDVYPLHAPVSDLGQGRIGRLTKPVTGKALIARVRKAVGVGAVLTAGAVGPRLTTAACAAGSAGSMFRAAASAGATFYLTGEMRHHDALAAAEAGMTVVCVGHSNSERPALAVLRDRMVRQRLMPAVKVLLARKDRDPFELRS